MSTQYTTRYTNVYTNNAPSYSSTNCYDRKFYRITKTTLNKSTRRIPVRPLPPRLPDILWTEHDDNTLLASPSIIIPGKSKSACTRRLSALRLEASLHVAAFESFTIFPKLPLEIQYMIWTLAAQEPRVVELHSVSLTTHLQHLQKGRSGYALQRAHFRSQTFDPPLLSTCTTSRAIALKYFVYRDLSNELFADSVYISLAHDIAFFSGKSLEKWFVSMSEIFHRGGSNVRERGAFPSSSNPEHPGSKIRTQLRSLALDAGWFLGPSCVASDGTDVVRRHSRVYIERLVIIWKLVWDTIKHEFEGVERLVLVLGDRWGRDGNGEAELGDRCFAAMRLEEVRFGEKGWSELDALRAKLGEWSTMRVERKGETVPVDVRLARVRSFGKK